MHKFTFAKITHNSLWTLRAVTESYGIITTEIVYTSNTPRWTIIVRIKIIFDRNSQRIIIFIHKIVLGMWGTTLKHSSPSLTMYAPGNTTVWLTIYIFSSQTSRNRDTTTVGWNAEQIWFGPSNGHTVCIILQNVNGIYNFRVCFVGQRLIKHRSIKIVRSLCV